VRLIRSEGSEWYNYYVDQFRMIFESGDWVVGHPIPTP
jgi:hypothetical protein